MRSLRHIPSPERVGTVARPAFDGGQRRARLTRPCGARPCAAGTFTAWTVGVRLEAQCSPSMIETPCGGARKPTGCLSMHRTAEAIHAACGDAAASQVGCRVRRVRCSRCCFPCPCCCCRLLLPLVPVLLLMLLTARARSSSLLCSQARLPRRPSSSPPPPASRWLSRAGAAYACARAAAAVAALPGGGLLGR